MENKNPECPCKSVECPRKANCDECRANHAEKGNLPACERPPVEEVK